VRDSFGPTYTTRKRLAESWWVLARDWHLAPQLLRIRLFFHGLHHETIILLFLLGTAVVCTFCGVALISYALLVGQALEEGGEFLVGVGMVAAGAIFGAIAVISSIVARFHRKVMALEDADEETGATSAQQQVRDEDTPCWISQQGV
jgi:hypothetical protein